MLDEKYRLDRLLEVGGMGAVYIGTHTRLQKQVAIKVLRRELAAMPDMIERFQREAVSASRIGHENIVNVSDLGTAQDGSPFLVMEYLTGQTLRDRIREIGALSIGVAGAIAREILAAIAAAHKAGIIHRDLKPENVFLVRGTRGESVKILDFGISRVMEAQGAEAAEWRLTATGQVMGTPYYMAPEQAAGRSDISGAVDLYAVGVILYEMLSGVVPFAAGNYNTIIYKVLAGEYEPLSSRLGNVPADLEATVHRAMALKPEDRFASADDFAAALDPFALAIERSSQRVPLMTDPRAVVERLAERSGAAEPRAGAGASPTNLGFAPTFTPPVQWRATGDGPIEMATTPDRPPRPRRRWLAAVVAAPVLAAAVTTGLLLLVDRGPAGDDAETPGPAATAEPSASGSPATAASGASGSGGAAGVPGRPGDPAAGSGDPAAGAVDDPAAEPAVAPAGPAVAPAEPADARVVLRFEVQPADATVAVDGTPLAGAELAAPRSDREVEVAVSRDGFKTKVRRVSLIESRTVEVILEKDRGADRRNRRGRREKPGADANRRDRGERIINDSPYD